MEAEHSTALSEVTGEDERDKRMELGTMKSGDFLLFYGQMGVLYILFYHCLCSAHSA